MKHIRTTQTEIVYTIEITETERQQIAGLLSWAKMPDNKAIYEFFRNELPTTNRE